MDAGGSGSNKDNAGNTANEESDAAVVQCADNLIHLNRQRVSPTKELEFQERMMKRIVEDLQKVEDSVRDSAVDIHGLAETKKLPIQPTRLTTDDLIRVSAKQLAEDDEQRLLLDKSDAENRILPLLNRRYEDIFNGVQVTAFGKDGKEYPMYFMIYKESYYLCGGWFTFCKKQGWREQEDFITIWVFRNAVTNKLSFVVSSRRKEEPEPLETTKKQRTE